MVKCPVCSGEVKLRDFKDIELTSCDKCGGHFLGPNDFRHVVKHKHNEKGHKVKDKGGDIECLQCKHTMDEMEYGGDSGVMIRKCEDCNGTWLAPGQAARIYDYLHSMNRYDRKVTALQMELNKTVKDLDEGLKEASKKYR